MYYLSKDEIEKLPQMLKVREASQILNVSRQYLHKLIRERAIPSYWVGRAIRIPRDQLFSPQVADKRFFECTDNDRGKGH